MTARNWVDRIKYTNKQISVLISWKCRNACYINTPKVWSVSTTPSEKVTETWISQVSSKKRGGCLDQCVLWWAWSVAFGTWSGHRSRVPIFLSKSQVTCSCSTITLGSWVSIMWTVQGIPWQYMGPGTISGRNLHYNVTDNGNNIRKNLKCEFFVILNNNWKS